MKRIVLVLLVILLTVCSLAACGGENAEPEVKVYTVEAKFNSDTVNQWKRLYLLDGDNYVLTVDAVDSRDASRVTAAFYMAGEYTVNEDGTVTIQPGYGYARVMNGETPMEVTVTPDENGVMDNMYLTMIGQFTTFALNSDGTWEGIGV